MFNDHAGSGVMDGSARANESSACSIVHPETLVWRIKLLFSWEKELNLNFKENCNKRTTVINPALKRGYSVCLHDRNTWGWVWGPDTHSSLATYVTSGFCDSQSAISSRRRRDLVCCAASSNGLRLVPEVGMSVRSDFGQTTARGFFPTMGLSPLPACSF